MAVPTVQLVVISLLMTEFGIAAGDVHIVHRVRKCIGKDYSMVCIKEELLDILNQTVMSHESFRLGNWMEIERDPEYVANHIDEDLPTNMEKRDEKLTELLYRKAEEYFESRSLRLHLADVIEGRKKKGGGGGGKMALVAMAATMMAQGMMTGKTAMVAVIALVLAKMAMMMCGVTMMKKMMSGGETQHIVYTADLGGGGGGGGYGSGGGWGRSLLIPSNHEIVYRAHTPSSLQENQYPIITP
ncbi:uncharacterized protein LOC108734501 [Agrilus planipennis]|uniref:Uncharacterized protein LOC108734501 n=1 Tax=Agrilus planipennis TaxID=224129 RepID=A0A1W4WC87_AGRPL|nr:uncharacterized protein LOC108734501 [Agrilus planipennis]